MRPTLIALLLLTACPPPGPGPAPIPPDADASPAPSDAAPPSTACQTACDVLTSFCRPQQTDCAATLEHLDHTHLIRELSGRPLTCADLAAAHSQADVRALGVACP